MIDFDTILNRFGERCSLVTNAVQSVAASSASEALAAIDSTLKATLASMESLRNRGKSHLSGNGTVVPTLVAWEGEKGGGGIGTLAHEHSMPLLLRASPSSSVLPAFKQLQDRAEQLTQRRRAIADVARQES